MFSLEVSRKKGDLGIKSKGGWDGNKKGIRTRGVLGGNK